MLLVSLGERDVSVDTESAFPYFFDILGPVARGHSAKMGWRNGRFVKGLDGCVFLRSAFFLMSFHKSLFSQVRYSAGRGHGLFAAEDVPRGGLVAEYVGEVITYDEWVRCVDWLAGWLVGWLFYGKFVDVCTCS
jgi:hypothetical protein